MACFQILCSGTRPPLPGDEEPAAVVAEEEGVDGVQVGPPRAAGKSRFWMRKDKRTVPLVDASVSGSSTGNENDRAEELQARSKRDELSVLVPAAAVAEDEGAKPTLLRRFFAKAHRKRTRSPGLDTQPPEVEINAGPDNSDTADAAVGQVGGITFTSPNTDMNRTRADHWSGSSKPSDRDRPPSTTKTTTSSSGLATFCPVFSSNCRIPAKLMAKSGGTSSNISTTTTTEEEADGDRNSRGAGVAAVVILILTLVLAGRFFAIVCTCTCFYLLPLFRAPTKKTVVRNKPRERRKSNALAKDCDSEEYSKRVVLEGPLQRRRNKPMLELQ